MDYNGWLGEVSTKFQRRFEEIRTNFNFEYDDEFELAIAETLAKIVPTRVGICRGFVVSQDGTTKGDDIILFDKSRFPTLRFLTDDLRAKQYVPAEAVLCYIEAKYSLYLKDTGASSGQTLEKALKQTSDIRMLARKEVPLKEIFPGINLGNNLSITTDELGHATTRNPYYTAIISGRVYKSSLDKTDPTDVQLAEAMKSIEGCYAPDCICAGHLLALPSYHQLEPDEYQIRQFMIPGNELLFCTPKNALGIAVAHLLWAIEHLQLGRIDWPSMFQGSLGRIGATVKQNIE